MASTNSPDPSAPVGSDTSLSSVPSRPVESVPLTWGLVLAAALVAGLGSWWGTERLLQGYKPSFEPVSKPYPSAEDVVRIARNRVQCGTVAFATTGGLLAALVGVAAGLSRRSISSALTAALVGLLVGVVVEGSTAWAGLRVFYSSVEPDEILPTLLCHAGIWGVVGLAVGLALGVGLGGRGQWWNTAIGGLTGVTLGVAVYQLLGAVLLANEGTQYPLADSAMARAISFVMIPLLGTVGALVAARPKSTKSAGQGLEPSAA